MLVGVVEQTCCHLWIVGGWERGRRREETTRRRPPRELAEVGRILERFRLKSVRRSERPWWCTSRDTFQVTSLIRWRRSFLETGLGARGRERQLECCSFSPWKCPNPSWRVATGAKRREANGNNQSPRLASSQRPWWEPHRFRADSQIGVLLAERWRFTAGVMAETLEYGQKEGPARPLLRACWALKGWQRRVWNTNWETCAMARWAFFWAGVLGFCGQYTWPDAHTHFLV